MKFAVVFICRTVSTLQRIREHLGSSLWPTVCRRSRNRIVSLQPRVDANANGAMVQQLETRALLATFTVTNSSDQGTGSLRQAIDDANAAAGNDVIEFSISGNGPHTIFLQDELPDVTDTVTIDGWSQPGFSGQPLIVINGDAAASDALGLDVRADGTVIRGLVIQEFGNDGMRVRAADNVVIQGNYIGTSADGSSEMANGDEGIQISDGSSGTLIGTNGDGLRDTQERNVVSGNADEGILLYGSSNNTVAGNYVGLGSDGTTVVANGGHGVLISADSDGVVAAQNQIGVSSPAARNVISGNVGDGVRISGGSQNTVSGNYIGLAADGLTARGNDDGISIAQSSNGVASAENVIGGPLVRHRNIVSGNLETGIQLSDIEVTGTVIRRNWIGVSASGSTRVANAGNGVTVDAALNTVIDANVISGNGRDGIDARNAAGTSITANFIGTNSAGTTAIGNQNGIQLQRGSTNTIVGGASTSLRNVVSGNLLDGIEVRDAETINNTIQGNLIGTNVTGLQAIPNGSDGVEFDGAGFNLLGGSVAGAGNVISGNTSDGVEVWRAAQGQVIQGNLIGVGVNGTTPLGNTRDGITISGGALQGNPPTIIYVIDVSGSTTSEPFAGTPVGDIDGDGTANTRLDAELDGFMEFTQRLHDLGFGNAVAVGITVFADSGVSLDMNPSQAGKQLSTMINADDNQNGRLDVNDVLLSIDKGESGVGTGTDFKDGLGAAATSFTTLGTRSGDGNIIFVSDGENRGGSFTDQLAILDGLGVKRIAIGIGSDARLTQLELVDPDATQVTSTDEFSNTLLAVLGLNPNQSGQQTVVGTNVTIGGSAAGAGNVIAYNGRDGVDVNNFLAIGNSILRNSIFGNNRLGINLGRSGVTPNDAGDGDAGANQLTNFPVITSVSVQGNQFSVDGTLAAGPNRTYRVELFGTDIADASGHGEGRQFLGFVNVTTNASGAGIFSKTVTANSAATNFIAATATGPDNNTSEFSAVASAIATPAGFTVTESGRSTTVSESGATDTLTVVLDARPISNVVMDISSSNVNEVTVSATTLTFTPNNWNATQTISITGVNDHLVDGGQVSTVTVSVNEAASDNAFAALADKTVAVTTVDDDTASFALSRTNITVSETAMSKTFTVVLAAQPQSNVHLLVSSNDLSEATASPNTLTFTPSNWNTAQIVTVTGVDDSVADGDQSSTITVQVDEGNGDDAFDAVSDKNVGVTTTDDESPRLSLSIDASFVIESDLNATTAVVSRDGDLSAPLTVDLSGSLADELAFPATITIPVGSDTSAEFDIVAIDDDEIDGNQMLTITATAVGFESGVGSIVVHDDDVAAIIINKTAATVSEDGTSVVDSFNVVLTAEPTSDVVLDLTLSANPAAALDVASLTFASANWNVAQTVNLVGLDDAIVDGDETTSITVTVNAALSDDAFDAVPTRTITVTTTDDDVDQQREFASADLDGSGGSPDQFTDGVLLLGFLAGLKSAAQLQPLMPSGATLTAAQAVVDRLSMLTSGANAAFDVDHSGGGIDQFTDGVLLLAYFSGLRQTAQLAPLVINPPATIAAHAVRANLDALFAVPAATASIGRAGVFSTPLTAAVLSGAAEFDRIINDEITLNAPTLPSVTPPLAPASTSKATQSSRTLPDGLAFDYFGVQMLRINHSDSYFASLLDDEQLLPF